MKRIITYQIKKEQHNKTIGQFLKEQEFSHQVIVNLKKTEKGILLNDTWAYVNERMTEGDRLTLTIEEKNPSLNILPVEHDLNILYEDEDLMIVNKPADMPIHPSMGNHDNTLANALVAYFNKSNTDFTFRCINRLDRDTTGLTIIAKHSLSAAILGRQVANRDIHRSYLAICEGKVEQTGTVDAPIARKADSTIQRCVDTLHGENAITHYQQVDYCKDLDLSLVKLKLETGRTHQIRVHMKHIGHPLVGDFLYNPNFKYIKRQALHSCSLEFLHPITKEKMHFHAPLAADMKCIFPLH